jgi:hypothetical protein
MLFFFYIKTSRCKFWDLLTLSLRFSLLCSDRYSISWYIGISCVCTILIVCVCTVLCMCMLCLYTLQRIYKNNRPIDRYKSILMWWKCFLCFRCQQSPKYTMVFDNLQRAFWTRRHPAWAKRSEALHIVTTHAKYVADDTEFTKTCNTRHLDNPFEPLNSKPQTENVEAKKQKQKCKLLKHASSCRSVKESFWISHRSEWVWRKSAIVFVTVPRIGHGSLENWASSVTISGSQLQNKKN